MTAGTQVRILTGAMRGLAATAVGPGPTADTIAVKILAAAGLVGVYAISDLATEESLAA